MKKLLVLAAGILQTPIIKRAHEMGYFVIAADGDAKAYGLKFADKAVCVDITSEEAVLELARKEKIDGVIHPCSEVSMNVMGRINDELHLSGVTRDQALRATNKHMMRRAFKKGGAPSPISILTASADDAWEHFCYDLDTDGILKPSRNSGSRGVSKVVKSRISKSEFMRLYNIAYKESRDKSVLLESFVDGPEFSVEIIVWNHKVNVIAVTDKKTTDAPHFVELGHNQPSCFPKRTVNKIKDAAVKGVIALGVNNCACHAEIKLQNNKAYVIEIGARLGGDFISTELTKLSTGIDMVAAAIDCAMGVEPDLESHGNKQSACIRYFCPKPGKLLSISNEQILTDSRVYKYCIYVTKGDTIPELTSSLCRSGHVIVTENTPEKAIELADRLVQKVEFKTV